MGRRSARPGDRGLKGLRRRATGCGAAVVAVVLTAGCQAPVTFYRSGSGDPGGPVVALGGAAPYVTIAPAGPSAEPPRRPRSGSAGPTTARAAGATPDVYAATRKGMVSPVARRFPARVYVPNSESGTVDVIDQRTLKIVGRFKVGKGPQHVVPSWDLRTLWVGDDAGDSLIPFSPMTGRPGRPRRVAGPYDLYFSPDGRDALVMAGRQRRIDFRDARTMRLRRSLKVPCRGLAHADYSAGETYLVAGCELSGRLVRVDPARPAVTGVLDLGRRSTPAEIRLSPDGSAFYVADATAGGVWIIDTARFRTAGFIRTGAGAYGLVPSRDGRRMYVTNRGAGTISLIDFATRRVTGRWRLPRGSGPETAGLSAGGAVLWISARDAGAVYAINTRTGRVLRRIKVGQAPHGLCVYPQPGRHSLGHTANFR